MTFFFTERELFVYEELRKGEKTSPFKVYIKEEFPTAAHYASNENVLDLIVVAEKGFAFAPDMKERMKDLDIKANRTLLVLRNVYGLAGYNHSLPDMYSFLVAQGPDLAKAKDLAVPRVVDLFALLCNLLEVEVPSSSVGEINQVKWMLRYPSDTQVVKVIRGWMAQALRPENVPITSTIRPLIKFQLI